MNTKIQLRMKSSFLIVTNNLKMMANRTRVNEEDHGEMKRLPTF
jgi:hypothetical protein